MRETAFMKICVKVRKSANYVAKRAKQDKHIVSDGSEWYNH